MPEKKHYFVQLIGTRADWPNDMTREEERIMGEHFVYLKNLVARKKVLMAGPVFDPAFGLIVLQAESEKAAREIMDSEPSVVQGVHTYEMRPMRASLLADYSSPDRYAENPTDRVLLKEVVVPADLEKVWWAWTTAEGIQSFFASNNHVELHIGGPFEIYFNMEAPFGERGSEGCRVLSFLPKRMLSFEWNAPPSFGDLRYKHTQVILMFEPIDPEQTKVTLTQLGWGSGEDWDGVYNYFNRAWSFVLENLKKSFE